MDIGPRAESGFDPALTELLENNQHLFIIIVRNHDLQKRITAVFIESMLMAIIGQIFSAIAGFAPASRSKPAHKLVQTTFLKFFFKEKFIYPISSIPYYVQI
jgi:hypothetical protein